MIELIKKNINSNQITQEDLIDYITKTCVLFGVELHPNQIPIIVQLFQNGMFNLKESMINTLNKLKVNYTKLFGKQGELIRVDIYE